MKKAIICTLLAGLLTTTAFAESVKTEVNLDTRDITISGTFSEAAFNRLVSIRVVEKENTEEEYYTNTFTTDEKGTYNYTFRMPEQAAKGYYIISLGVVGADETKEEIYFAKSSDISELLATINGAASASVIRTAIELNMNILNLTNSWYDRLNNDAKDAISQVVYKKKTYATLSAARKIIVDEIAVQAFKTAAKPDEIVAALNAFSDLYDINETSAKCYNLYQSFAYQTEALELMAASSPTTLGEVLAAYNESILLVAINHVKEPIEIKNYISEYKSVIPSAILSVYDKSNTDKTISHLYKIGTFSNMKAFGDAVEAAYKAQQPESKGPGGGGGGKGDGGVIPYAPPMVTEEQDEDNSGTNNSEFADLADATWAQEAIQYLADRKIVSGTGDGRFEPNSPVTREQFAMMVISAFGLNQADAECNFSDLPATHWAYKAVASAYANGIVSGVSETEFGTGIRISRQDMAVMTYKAAKAAGYDFDGGFEVSFADHDDIAGYAEESVRGMSSKKIINGYPDGRFAPNETATRAQAAQVIYTIIK